ncbi:MAG TPA: energy transducer TonB, partial [Candidatus Polarisedimenticolia bacterium]|nr:energy transducer TonB [Candidatus Polarisedimenticolia bacterium]
MFSRVIALIVLALLVPFDRQYPDEAGQQWDEALEEFLVWSDPATEECGPPEKIKVVRRWPGFIRVRFERPCEPAPFDALLEIREGQGVWQVHGGYVASRSLLDRALATAGGPDPGGAAAEDSFLWPEDGAQVDRSEEREGEIAPPSSVSPPPDNPGAGTSSAAAMVPARVLHREDPVVPAEARRARLFSPVRVEVLVDLSADGTPGRARILRGPQPDLGMRRSAVEATRRWRFAPAILAGEKVRSFAAVDVVFEGLPPESLGWIHRALFRFDAVISADDLVIGNALERLRGGDPFAAVAAGAAATVE